MNKMYQCVDNGVVVEIVAKGMGDGAFCLQCCGKEMKEVKGNTVDAAKEKHVPVMTGDEKGVKIVVGALPHPMEKDHYIEWIEVINGAYVNRKYLQPGEKPEAEFYVPKSTHLIVRAFCNKHGLWQA